VKNGYLFKEGEVCIPQGSHRKLLMQETHGGGGGGGRGGLWPFWCRDDP